MSVVIFPQIPVEIDDATMQEDAPHAQMDMSPGRSPPQLGQPFNSFSNTISNTIQPQWPSSQSEQVQQHQDPMMITQEDGSMNMADAQIIPEIEPDQMHYEEDGTTEVDMGNGEVLEQEYEMMGDAEELNEEVMAADQSFEAEQPLITAFTASDYAEVEHPPAQTLPLQADVAITPTPLLSQTMMTQSQTQPVGAPSIQFDGPISPPAQEKPSVPDNSHSEASRPDAEPLPLPHPQVEEVSQVDHASNAHSEAVQSSEAADPEALPEQPSYSASQGQEFKNDQHLSAEDKDHPTEPASATEAPSNHQDVEYTENPIPPILLSLQIPGSPAPAKLHALFTSPEPSTITSLLSTNVEDEAPTLLLASQPHLFFANLAELLIELREELLTKGFRKEIFDFKELILSARALDLTLSEDNVYAREVSLYDFAVLHQSCSVPGYLHLDLSLQVRFRSRYEEIKRAIAASENQLYQQETEDETRTDTENAHPAEEQGSLSTAPEALKDEEPQDEPLKTHAAVDSVTDNTAIHGPMPTPGSTPRKETKNVTGVQTDSDLGEDVEDEQEYYNEEAQPQPQTADNPSADENQAVEDPLLEWKDEDYPPLPPEEDGDYLNDDEGDYEEPVAGGENKTELESIANPQPESENNGQNVNHELDNTGEHSQESAADGIEHANENDNDLQEHAEIFAAPDDASEDPPAEQIPEPEEPTVIDAQESSNHYIAEHTAEQVGESIVEQGNEEQEIPPLDPVEAQYDGDEDHHDYFDEALVPLLGQDDDVSTLQESEEQEQELGNFEQEETTWNERVGEESELYLDEKNYVDALADEDPVVPPLQAENSLKNPSPARSTSGAKRRYEEYAEEDAAEEDAAVLDTKRARLV